MPTQHDHDMSVDNNQVLEEIKDLKRSLATKPEAAQEHWLKILEKLILPVGFALLTWISTQAATSISQGQLILARTVADDRKVEFKRGMQAKFIEIFYKDLNSGNQQSQLNAIRLVRLVDTELAQNLLSLVEGTPGVSKEVLNKAARLSQDLKVIQPLSGFTVALHYKKGDTKASENAIRSRDRLLQAGFSGSVELVPGDENFFQRVGHASNIEIRYEAGIEDEAANSLLAILQPINEPNKIVKEPVTTRIPNYISVFFPSGV